MTHRAETIVSTIVTRVTGLATTAGRVYRGRFYPLQASELPALLVYLGADRPQGEYSHSLIDSLLTVKIESRVKSPTAQLDTTLNLIREEVTIALQADHTQTLSYVINTIEGDAEEPEFVAEGDQPIGRQVLTWQFLYRRSRTNPGA